MRAIAGDYISEEEYVRLEDGAGTKHEYFNGCIYAMAGGTPAHNQIASSILAFAHRRLGENPCRAVNSDRRVKVEATGLKTYPDTLIVCPPEQYATTDPNSLVNPRVVFEVLSSSTEVYERTVKFDHYRQIPSLLHYVLVGQDQVRVDHYTRGEAEGWVLRSYNQRHESLVLPDLELELPLDEIYHRLDLPAGLLLLPESPE